LRWASRGLILAKSSSSSTSAIVSRSAPSIGPIANEIEIELVVKRRVAGIPRTGQEKRIPHLQAHLRPPRWQYWPPRPAYFQ
jgi:hypothetical protein